MEPNEIKLPSGAVLVITPAAFWEAVELNDAVMECFKNMPPEKKITEIGMIETFMSVATSATVRAALRRAFARCTYDGQKIDDELFDAPNYSDRIRKDFYTLCGQVVKANCEPFFVETFSELGTLFGMTSNTQK